MLLHKWPSRCLLWGSVVLADWRTLNTERLVYSMLGPVGGCHFAMALGNRINSLKQAPDEVTPREPAIE